MTRLEDLTGARFGLWTVIRKGEKTAGGRTTWVCQCTCGVTKYSVNSSHLLNGSSTNCGCDRQRKLVAAATEASTQHGLYGSKTYWAWKSMKQRCSNPKNASYKHYGGRGISFDPAWNTFIVFLGDMGEAPEGLSLDRKDVNGNYCKDNCRWATNEEQASNRRNTVRLKAENGEVRTLVEWTRVLNVSRDYLKSNSLKFKLQRI